MDEYPVGVVVMAYGSPASTDDVEAYYTHVRRSRPPTPELLADLLRRYEAIGGLSPLTARTQAQADALAAALGEGWAVEQSNKHAAPFIEDGVKALARLGARKVVGIVLAPHASSLSTGEYHARAREVAVPSGMAYRIVAPWGSEPALVELLAERVRDGLARFPPEARVMTLITAHSLPERSLDYDRPTYPEQLEATAVAVAERAGISEWRVGWQSAGRTPEPWIGPDLLEIIRGLPAEGYQGVLVCPAGFVSDHLEVLYDVDIEARAVAEEVGLVLERTDSLNDDPAFIALLVELVRGAA